MLGIDRRARSNERPLRRIALIWGAVSCILLITAWTRIAGSQFPDPDDILRLVQVRDLLAGQGWFDLVQHRIDPPQGTLMHWSRLVDIPLALMVLVLTPILGTAQAETVALVVAPLITLGLIMACIGALAWRLFDVRVAGFACLALGLLGPLVFQIQPMRIDHHGWQAFTVALALWALAHRSAAKGGAIAGLAMAAGMSISIEILPLAAAFGGVLALRWLRDHQQRWWLVTYMQVLALALVVNFLATRGIGDLAQHCDQIAPAHLGFFGITALATAALAAGPVLPRFALIGGLALAGAAGLVFFGLSSPTCLTTPFGALDPLVREYWYVQVLEGRPLWEQDLALAVPVLVQLLIALAVAVQLCARSRDWLRLWWLDYALLLGASILLSLFVWRSAALASVIAAVPLGYLATRLLQRVKAAHNTVHRLGAAVAVMVVLLPAAPVTLVQTLLPDDGVRTAKPVREANCAIGEQATKLNRFARGTVFAPLDIGPSILLQSHHSVIATSHHRAEQAMADVIRTFTGSEDEARGIIQAHGADYVALCSDLAEAQLYAASGPNSFAAQLIEGNPPPWLEPVATGGPAEFRLWRVVAPPPVSTQE